MKSTQGTASGAAGSAPGPARKLLSLVSTLLILAAMTGCTNENLFGNDPEPDTVDCSAFRPSPAPGVIDQNVDRPISTPFGNSWITYRIAVEAIGPPPNGDNTYCVPVDIEYTKSVADADLLLENQNGMPETVMPVTNTPWQEFVSFNYDPKLERFQGNPPTYRIDLKATFYDYKDHNTIGEAQAFRCSIALNGATIAQDLKIVPAGNTCFVTITNNLFRPY